MGEIEAVFIRTRGIVHGQAGVRLARLSDSGGIGSGGLPRGVELRGGLTVRRRCLDRPKVYHLDRLSAELLEAAKGKTISFIIDGVPCAEYQAVRGVAKSQQRSAFKRLECKGGFTTPKHIHGG